MAYSIRDQPRLRRAHRVRGHVDGIARLREADPLIGAASEQSQATEALVDLLHSYLR